MIHKLVLTTQNHKASQLTIRNKKLKIYLNLELQGQAIISQSKLCFEDPNCQKVDIDVASPPLKVELGPTFNKSGIANLVRLVAEKQK